MRKNSTLSAVQGGTSGLPDISNNVGPVKHFLSRLLHLLKRVFSSASFVVFLIGLDKYGSFVI